MLEKTGIYVLRALALYVGLDEFYFDKSVAEGNSILRQFTIHQLRKSQKMQ